VNTNQFVKLLEENADKTLQIMLPSGEFIPDHFHITEVGQIQKKFIDCGGTIREITSCLLQVWTANDFEHRLVSSKLSKIMNVAKEAIPLGDFPVEIEYGDAASHYSIVESVVTSKCLLFMLFGKQTACLAPDKCGVTGCC